MIHTFQGLGGDTGFAHIILDHTTRTVHLLFMKGLQSSIL